MPDEHPENHSVEEILTGLQSIEDQIIELAQKQGVEIVFYLWNTLGEFLTRHDPEMFFYAITQLSRQSIEGMQFPKLLIEVSRAILTEEQTDILLETLANQEGLEEN